VDRYRERAQPQHDLDDLVEENDSFIAENADGAVGRAGAGAQRRQEEVDALEFERHASRAEHLLDQIVRLLPQLRQLPPDRARKSYDRVLATLVALTSAEWRVFCRVRRQRWEKNRRAILHDPQRVPDKLRRITALADLKYGTPRWEIDAAIARMKAGNDLDLGDE